MPTIMPNTLTPHPGDGPPAPQPTELQALLERRFGSRATPDVHADVAAVINPEREPDVTIRPSSREEPPEGAPDTWEDHDTIFETQAAQMTAQLATEKVAGTAKAALRFYEQLLALALWYGSTKGITPDSPGNPTVTFHLPVEAAAHVYGRTRRTIHTYIQQLKTAGLLNQTGHVGHQIIQGSRRMDGSLWKLTLNPVDPTNRNVRFNRHDFTHPDGTQIEYRDLERDIDEGNTVYAAVRKKASQSSPRTRQTKNLKSLRGWVLSPGSFEKAVGLTGKEIEPRRLTTIRTRSLDALLDLRDIAKNRRRDAVDHVADVLSERLRDAKSRKFFAFVCWQALRWLDAGVDKFHYLHATIRAVQSDFQYSRRDYQGVELVKRWKHYGTLDWLRDAPPTRVAGRAAT